LSRWRAVLAVGRQGLALSCWRLPRSQPMLVGFGAFALACLLSLLLFFVQDRSLTEAPATLFWSNGHLHASYFLAVLLAAWLAARVLQRPALWLALATLAVLVGTVWNAIALWVLDAWLVDGGKLQRAAWQVLLAMGGLLALYRCVAFLSRGTPALRRLAATLAFAIVLAGPWYWQQQAWFWYPPEAAGGEVAGAGDTVPGDSANDDGANGNNANDGNAPLAPEPAPGTTLPDDVDAEALLAAQPGRIRRAVAALRPQTPGRIDLFTIGFAGDGGERVFRNEVEYFDRLVAGRFQAAHRSLSLVNSPATIDRVPLATMGNLRQALAGVGARMDPKEDVLLLFLTSHGSRDHHLYVGLEPLPLHQVSPQDLRDALDAAHIGWRVVVVSACYSGGFVDALRDEHTLVITAARADRSSFGCGSDSTITWFGKAFLAGALNRTTDFEQAYELANHQVREWELRDGQTPSLPQMAGGWAIRRHLAEWRRTLPDSPPVPFAP
jgi:hypothetical protein